MRPRSLVTFVPAVLATFALAPPLLGREHPLAVLSIGQFFSVVCHQDPARSFWIAGAPVAVCARCLGIYLGAAVGAWIRISHARALRFVAIAAAVNFLDAVGELLGLHTNWMVVRFAFGLALGAGIATLIVASWQRGRVPHVAH